MMKLTILEPIAIADLGLGAWKGTGSVQPSALTVMSDENEARAWQAPLHRSPHLMSRAGARPRPVHYLMRLTTLERCTTTCPLLLGHPEKAIRLAQLKLRRRTYRSSVDSVVPQLGRTPRHSVGRVVLHASRFPSWPRLNERYQAS